MGDPAFDSASLIRDRREWLLGHPHPQTVLERRLQILGGDVERTREWAIAHALAWGPEANTVHRAHLEVAQYLAG